MEKSQKLRTEALIEIYEREAERRFKKPNEGITVSQVFERQLLGDDSKDKKGGGKNKKQEKKKTERKQSLDPVSMLLWQQRCREVHQELKFDVQKQQQDDKAKRKAYLASEVVETSCIPIINDMNKVKQLWDMFVLALAVITSFSVGFELVLTSLSTNNGYEVFTYVSDMLFLIDIGIQFRTTYFSMEGEEVRDWKKIAIRYMQGMFIFDLVATIPWSLFDQPVLKLLKILKVTRITRFTKVIEKLELKEDQKAIVKIVKLILVMLLTLHIIGCIMFLIVGIKQEWVPPLDYIYVQRVGYYRFYDQESVNEFY